MKALGLLLLLCLATLGMAQGNPTLVLIQPFRAGPDVDIHMYVHPQWIQWPAPATEAGLNRLHSLVTGMDWQSRDTDFTIAAAGDGFRVRNYEVLKSRGHFEARRRTLGGTGTALVASGEGSASPASIVLAVEEGSPVVGSVTAAGLWPKGELLVFEARSWNEIVELTRSTQGRTLVLEFPPLAGQSWSRFWRFGQGWPEGIPVDPDSNVPGLCPARSAAKLLLDPKAFRWQKDDTGEWGGANRWFEHVQQTGKVVLGLLVALAAAIFVYGVYLMTTERRQRLTSLLVQGALVVPAALVLGGNGTRLFGIGGWFVWVGMAVGWLGITAILLGIAQRRLLPRAHPLLAVAAVSFASLSLADPTWSILSPHFGESGQSLSPLVLVAWFGSLVLLLASLRDARLGSEWAVRAVAAACLGWGLLARPWWGGQNSAFLVLPLLAWLVAEGRIRPWMLLGVGFLTPSVLQVARNGLTWAPNGLHPNFASAEAFDLSQYARFFLSPFLLVMIAVTGLVSLFGDRFFVHQCRRMLAQDPRRRALWAAGAGMFVLGLLNPAALEAAVFLAVGALGVLLIDGLRPFEPTL
jgi:hypothetical protein